MKKLTAVINGKETIINLQDSILTTKYTYVFIKKATIFWEYENITVTFIAIRDVAKTNIIHLSRGYYTFDDIKDQLSDYVTLSSRKNDGKCEIVNDRDTEFLLAKYMCDLLGYDCDDVTGKYKRILPKSTVISDRKVNINRGLRYICVSCNLIDMGSSIYADGKKSSVITSLPVTTTQSLFGSVSNYVDIESKVPVVKGSFSEVKFNVTDQGGNPIDVGQILLELYIV